MKNKKQTNKHTLLKPRGSFRKENCQSWGRKHILNYFFLSWYIQIYITVFYHSNSLQGGGEGRRKPTYMLLKSKSVSQLTLKVFIHGMEKRKHFNPKLSICHYSSSQPRKKVKKKTKTHTFEKNAMMYNCIGNSLTHLHEHL